MLPVSQCHPVLSQDLGSTDLKRERLFLVCQIIRVGRMDLRDSHSRKLSTGLRRPFGISGGGGLHGDPQGLPCHHPGTPPAITPSSVMSLGCSHCPFSLPAHTVPPGLSLPKGQNTRPVLAQGTPSTARVRCPQNPGETPCLHLPPPSCSGHGSLSGGATSVSLQ